MVRCDEGSIGRVVNVGHQRHLHAALPQLISNVPQVFGFSNGRRGHPNDLTTDVDQLHDLLHGGFGIHCVGNCHRLDADGIVAAHCNITHVDDAAFAALVMQWIYRANSHVIYPRLAHPIQ